MVTFLFALFLLASLGAVVVLFTGTSAGDGCMAVVLLALCLVAIGSVALIALLFMGAACSAVFR